MKILSLASIALLLAGCAAPAPEDAGATEGAVRALLDDSVRSWNAGDLERFCSFYAPDARFVTPSGVTEGRDAVLERYRRRYPDRAAMGTLALEPVAVRVLGDAATVIARWSLDYEEGTGREPASGLTLLVMARGEAGWRITEDASFAGSGD